MNLANKLTLLRVLFIPFFVFCLLNGMYLTAFILFALASITDWLDGYVARKYNMITDLGKFLDPLADKILVISALVCFIEVFAVLRFPGWAVILIIAREFIVSGFRLAVVSKDNKAVIAADSWGKIKTAATMLTVCSFLALLVFYTHIPQYLKWYDINIYLLYICTALTVYSGFTMIWKNRKLFGE
ncbi:MAG: CDP-diacylglycerol--glycerol-3-phosphate 3-phosphatidyltransferase [Oscillospiraceae bacterium]|nr:CDP-diacylglycerol--glycerol-3-phosphate 3-phosphatidyltransferase [Oscillospiraceae bacterium]